MRLRIDDIANSSGLLAIQINQTCITSKENDHKFVLRTRPPTVSRKRSKGTDIVLVQPNTHANKVGYQSAQSRRSKRPSIIKILFDT